ncbi:hypothetical protein JOF39_002885 [Glutamicibacter protophormiae]|uniref:Uncharacterized protein n=1 Tax=Glutamicibacter protophormiae TaxID=37930 RepID=A0ABS4XTG2_GLUPR|nr:hypothetical protein [Glutamicibacter protophormiae]GGL77496.1 hypothetical protein GCM10010038_04580 [Glutamicibacter protophormiae]
MIELKDYPAGTRIYLRAEPLHPGAKATLFGTDGNQVTAFLTNSPRFNVAFLDARHRVPNTPRWYVKSGQSVPEIRLVLSHNFVDMMSHLFVDIYNVTFWHPRLHA